MRVLLGDCWSDSSGGIDILFKRELNAALSIFGCELTDRVMLSVRWYYLSVGSGLEKKALSKNHCFNWIVLPEIGKIICWSFSVHIRRIKWIS